MIALHVIEGAWVHFCAILLRKDFNQVYFMRPGTASSRFHETLRKLRHFCFFIVPPDAATQRIADLLRNLYHKIRSSKVAQGFVKSAAGVFLK